MTCTAQTSPRCWCINIFGISTERNLPMIDRNIFLPITTKYSQIKKLPLGVIYSFKIIRVWLCTNYDAPTDDSWEKKNCQALMWMRNTDIPYWCLWGMQSKQLIASMTINGTCSQQFKWQPSTHLCVTKNINKLDNKKGSQTKSALIAAVGCICI